jgi:hypothetical protein
VLGIAIGLFLLLGLLGALTTKETSPVDGGALLTEWFGMTSPPGSYEVAEAVRRRGRFEVLLADPEAPEEAPKREPEKNEEGELAEVDWTSLPIGPEGSPPVEVLVLHWPSLRSAAGELERLFGRPERERGGDEDEIEIVAFGPEGGRAVLDSGRLPWGEYAVMYVHERELESGGTFRDVIRANLALEDSASVVFARWARGVPGSKERMIELLEAFRSGGS